jgi:hypothetical protein
VAAGCCGVSWASLQAGRLRVLAARWRGKLNGKRCHGEDVGGFYYIFNGYLTLDMVAEEGEIVEEYPGWAGSWILYVYTT